METGLVKMNHDEEALPELVTDQLLALAEQAEKRIEAMKRIKSAALKLTNVSDWIDQSGKPWLEASGSEKIARAFNVSWTIGEPEIDVSEDGHYLVTYKGQFSMGSVTIEAIGTRFSGEKFFVNRFDDSGKVVTLSPREINKGNVKKSAYTNCLANGITRLLGLRNLTYEELSDLGITREKITQFRRRGKKSDSGNRGGTQGGESAREQGGPGGNQLTQLRLKIGKLLSEKFHSIAFPVAMEWMEEFAGANLNGLSLEQAEKVLKELEKSASECSLTKFANGEQDSRPSSS